MTSAEIGTVRRLLVAASRFGSFAVRAAALGAAALLFVSLASAPRAHAATANVTVANFSFTDSSSLTSTTTIHVGDTVTWTWSSGTHSSCSGGACPANATDPWDSGIFSTPHMFSRQFNTAGTFHYWCSVHTTAMTGTVIVLAASPSVGGVAVLPDVSRRPLAATSSNHRMNYVLPAAVAAVALICAGLWYARRRAASKEW